MTDETATDSETVTSEPSTAEPSIGTPPTTEREAAVAVAGVASAVDAAAHAIASAPRQIEYLPLADLKADPRNPKAHDLATIDSSYDRFGVVDIITRDDRTGYIISGHGRRTTLEDAYSRGETPPEGVMLAEDGTWLVPVTTGWSSKNDAEAAAALISMNRLTELGGWADDSLLALLSELSETGAGFDGVGFSETDLDDLRHLLEDVPELDALADEYDPDAAVGSSGGKAVTIKLTDVGLIGAWHEARDSVKTDDDAFRFLISGEVDPAAAKPVKKTTRAKDPTPDDVASEPATDPGPDASYHTETDFELGPDETIDPSDPRHPSNAPVEPEPPFDADTPVEPGNEPDTLGEDAVIGDIEPGEAVGSLSAQYAAEDADIDPASLLPDDGLDWGTAEMVATDSPVSLDTVDATPPSPLFIEEGRLVGVSLVGSDAGGPEHGVFPLEVTDEDEPEPLATFGGTSDPEAEVSVDLSELDETIAAISDDPAEFPEPAPATKSA